METFNEIRVQFQQMWGTRGQISEEYTTYVSTQSPPLTSPSQALFTWETTIRLSEGREL